MPVTAISSVRGIGVADIVSTSTLVRMCLSCSLCSTPKRCSSSTITRPRSLKLHLAGQDAVGADDDVEAAVGEPGLDLLGLLVALEPGQRARP